jgi:hypothetical protein
MRDNEDGDDDECGCGGGESSTEDPGVDGEGTTIPVVSKADFDFGFLAAGQTYQRVLVNRIRTFGFNQCALFVRVHAKQASSGSSVRVRVDQTAPTDEDDGNFVVTSPSEFLGVSVTSGATTPALIRSAVAFEPGECLRISIEGTGGSTSVATFTLSADLLLRAAPRPCVEVSQHNYNTSATTQQFIPMNSQVEAGSIGIDRQWVAPGDGELVEAQIMNATPGGFTTIGFHRNGSVTAEETQSVTISATLVASVVTFKQARFVKGDRIHISVTSATGPGNVWVSCRFHYSKV